MGTETEGMRDTPMFVGILPRQRKKKKKKKNMHGRVWVGDHTFVNIRVISVWLLVLSGLACVILMFF